MIALQTYYDHKDISSIQLLLSHGADPNARDEGTFDDYDDYRVFPYWGGYTVLGFAARHGLLGAVRLLLKHGADPTLKRVDGTLPENLGTFVQSVLDRDNDRRVVLEAREEFSQVAVKGLGYLGAEVARYVGVTGSCVTRIVAEGQLTEDVRLEY
jgi:hypothetical protein